MVQNSKEALFERLQKRSSLVARAKATLSRHPLPPGELDPPLDLIEKSDRSALLKRAARLGPIFKGTDYDELCVCIVGLARCRRFLAAHVTDLRVSTIEVDRMIPKGFLCQMEGADHLHYRRATARAVHGADVVSNQLALERIATEGLATYAATAAEHRNEPEAFTASVSAIATGMLTRLFLGAEIGSDAYDRFNAHFRELGPYGLVWNPQKRQEVAYQAFRDDVAAEVELLRSGQSGLAESSLLAGTLAGGTLDETALGNLIYRAEMGRSDIKNLFRWLTRHVTDDPSVLDRVADEQLGGVKGPRSVAEAFVLETLRTDQSERLMRRATNDIVFEGFLIPRNAMVRLCMWESHHDVNAFDDPHRFDPQRFLSDMPSNDRFAPFGVDHHQCPMGGISIQIGTIFLNALARHYSVKRLAEGPPVRGAYHWEPSRRFTVELVVR